MMHTHIVYLVSRSTVFVAMLTEQELQVKTGFLIRFNVTQFPSLGGLRLLNCGRVYMQFRDSEADKVKY